MKFSIVPVGVVPKTLNEIRLGLIDEFKKPKSKSQCIIEIRVIFSGKISPIGYFGGFFQKINSLFGV